MRYSQGWGYMWENNCNRMMVKTDEDILTQKFLPDNLNTSIWKELIILGVLSVFVGECILSKACNYEWLVECCAFRASMSLKEKASHGTINP